MPVEELRQEPARRLLEGTLGGIDGDIFGELRDQGGDAFLTLVEFFGGRTVLGCRPGDDGAVFF